MQLLLDTHVLLWWLTEPEALKPAARGAISDPRNMVWLSSVVVWEIRIKQTLGKLEVPEELAEILSKAGFVELPVRVSHAHRVATLPDIHRDPFDRLLVAQALVEDLDVVTRDAFIPRYGVRSLPA